MKLIIVINKAETISLKPPRFILKERVVWILIACLGKFIRLNRFEGLIQNEELIKNKDHREIIHVIMCIENKVELWSSKEEKMSTIILSFVRHIYVCFQRFINGV